MNNHNYENFEENIVIIDHLHSLSRVKQKSGDPSGHVATTHDFECRLSLELSRTKTQWYIPNQFAKARIFPLSTISSL